MCGHRVGKRAHDGSTILKQKGQAQSGCKKIRHECAPVPLNCALSHRIGFGVADACTLKFVPHPFEHFGRFGDGSGIPTASGNICTLQGRRASKSAQLRGWSAPQKSMTRGASRWVSDGAGGSIAAHQCRRGRRPRRKRVRRGEEGVCPCL
jgi:hypothetical protein